MTTPLPRPATADDLFVWVLHRFAEEFEEHAVLKGGIALRLLDCPRSTTDIDYVFVPYASKKTIRTAIERLLRELPEAESEVSAHSRIVRATLAIDGASIQIEANVSLSCASIPMSSGGLARRSGQPPRIVRIMEPSVALAHKLAAWNERRLLRDVYDVWFLTSRIGAQPDLATLGERLAAIESRHPVLRRRTSMTRSEFAQELRVAAGALDERDVRDALAPLLPPDDLVGLLPRLRNAMLGVADALTAD
jgi:hypothetical protein